MDENEFLTTESSVNAQPCAFSKAILRRCCGCSHSQKLFIAEREVVACLSPGAWQRCRELLDLIRQNALFALRLTQIEGSLPHGKEIKVQCGGLQGLNHLLHPEPTGKPAVTDIHGLINEAVTRIGSLQAIPYSELVKAISRFQSRSRNP